MRDLRRDVFSEQVDTARQAEPGSANLGHEEFKQQCKEKTELGECYPSQLILSMMGDAVSKKGNQVINLSHQGITAKLAEALGHALRVNTFVTELNLKDNVLGSLGVSALVKSLSSNYYIKKLDLSTNNLGPPTQIHSGKNNEVELRPGAAEDVGSFLRESGSLTEISLSNNKLEDKDLAEIIDAVRDAGYIVKIDISRNKGADLLGEALNQLVSYGDSSVLELDISWNKLTHHGALALAEGMRSNKALQKLNISWNSIGNQAGRVFGEVLAGDKVLEYLDLGNCKLETPAITVIAHGLAENKTLERLVLDNNYLGLYAGKALLRAIILQDKTKVAEFHKCILAKDEYVLEEVEQNLTGHYTLNLKLEPLADGTPHPHTQIMRRFADMAEESAGNMWRNEMMNAVPFSFPWHTRHFVNEDPKLNGKWPMPALGKKDKKDATLYVELDFVSNVFPEESEESIEMFIFDHVIQILQNIPADATRIALVQMLSLACFFRCQQVERIIELFPYRDERVNVAIYFYNRVIDHGEYMDTLISALGNEQMQDVARRLGPAKVFNEEEPDGHYRLILDKKEDRDLFVHLIELAAGESEPSVDKCCFQVRLNACNKRPVKGEDGIVQMLDIFEDRIEDEDGAAPKEEEAPPEDPNAPPAPPKIEVISTTGGLNEADLPFKIPETGILEFDYVGA